MLGGLWKANQADNHVFHSPSGRVHCTIADWARFAALRLETEKPKILDRETLDDMVQSSDNYAAGWVVAQREWANGTAFAHSGSNGQWFATIWVAPKLNRIFMVATNCCENTQQTQRITNDVVSALIEIGQIGQ